MNINDAFPSKYIRASDLNGAPMVLTMSGCQEEVVDTQSGKKKPILYFQENDISPLALNKTNAGMIAAIYGPETQGWMGHQIELFPSMTEFQGQPTSCIRVRQPQQLQQPQQPTQPTQPVPPRPEPIVNPQPYNTAPATAAQAPLGPTPPPIGTPAPLVDT